MALKKFSYLCTLCLCLVTSKSQKLPSITDKQFIQQCVSFHNELRGQANPPAADMKYMNWNETLAKLAKAGADICEFKHRDCLSQRYGCSKIFEYVGENIWLGDIKIFTPNNAITYWYNETAFYDFESISCSQVCGHYTQIVWANSDKLGCGATICPNLGGQSTVLFICNYAPGGNFVNERPYTKGTPCSMCSEKEKCTDKLCQSKAERPSGRSPHWIIFNVFSLNFVLLKIF